MRLHSPSRSVTAGLLALCLSLSGLACYRPGATPRPRASEADLGQAAYEALSNRAGTILIIEPRHGRILRRIGRGADIQFTSSPFEIAEIVTAYAALEAGLIHERTLLACHEPGAQTDVVGALAHSCPAFFAALSQRLPPAAWARAASAIGFTYYGIDTSNAGATVVHPVTAKLPAEPSGAAFTALATRGAGMEAKDLHFAQLVSSLGSGTTAAERFAAYIATTARAPAPPSALLNKAALAVVRRGLLKAVDEGEAKAAANIDHKVAGKMGGGDAQAVFISYAPAHDPQIGLVVYLKEGAGRDAAEVAGKFYQAYFKS